MFRKFYRSFNEYTNHPDFGRLLLRLTFGVLMLFHGVAKLRHGVDWIYYMLQSLHIPGFVAYGVFIGEIISPVLLILGFYTRPVALIYSFNILIATLLVGLGSFFTLTEVGAWGLESEALYFMGGMCIMFLGAGKYRLSARNE